jgi:hypothetical protein
MLRAKVLSEMISSSEQETGYNLIQRNCQKHTCDEHALSEVCNKHLKAGH